jgi:hypothetical protein
MGTISPRFARDRRRAPDAQGESPLAGALFHFDVLQPDPSTGMQAVACLLDPAQESRIVLGAIVEPILLRFEADQHARRLAVTRDDDLLRLGLARVAGGDGSG